MDMSQSNNVMDMSHIAQCVVLFSAIMKLIHTCVESSFNLRILFTDVVAVQGRRNLLSIKLRTFCTH